jgi:hypothetical protein
MKPLRSWRNGDIRGHLRVRPRSRRRHALPPLPACGERGGVRGNFTLPHEVRERPLGHPLLALRAENSIISKPRAPATLPTAAKMPSLACVASV